MIAPSDVGLSSVKRRPGLTVAQTAATALLDYIRGGQIEIGSPLPPQRELAQNLNVSRASLREALTILSTSGVVSIEPGRGTFVRELPEEGFRPLERRGWPEAKYSPEEVFQFRYIAESYAAQLAAMNHTQVELDEIKSNLETFRRARQTSDYELFVNTDFEFHQLIIRFSQNRLLVDIQGHFAGVVNQSQQLPLEGHNRFWEPVVEHERIVEALAMRDPAGAAYYMRQHLSRACARANIKLTEVI